MSADPVVTGFLAPVACAAMSNVAVIVKLPIVAGKRDEAVAALQTLIDIAKTEAGTLTYILHTDAADENVVWFYELYTDQAAFDAHSSSEGFKAFGPSLASMIGGAPEFHFVTPVSGKGL
jgi:quinol monooxygenase YgiN